MPWSCAFLFIPLVYALPILITNSVTEGADLTLLTERLPHLKRQADWTVEAYPWYSLYGYPSYWTYARNYYSPGPDLAPYAVNQQPWPPYDTPPTSYNPCADRNSVNWKVTCNGGGYQKTTTNLDGSRGSVQQTGSFYTWKYGEEAFNQPFKALGTPSVGGKFPESQTSQNCINGLDSNGLPCSSSGGTSGIGDTSGIGGGSNGISGTTCVNGIDSNGKPCSGNNHDDDNDHDGDDCVNGTDSKGNKCGGSTDHSTIISASIK